MKRIIVRSKALAATQEKGFGVNTAIAGTDEWWDGMPKEFQAKYIKEHPNSKYAKNAAKKSEKGEKREAKLTHQKEVKSDQKNAKADKKEKISKKAKVEKNLDANTGHKKPEGKKKRADKPEEKKPYVNPGNAALKKYREEQAAKKAKAGKGKTAKPVSKGERFRPVPATDKKADKKVPAKKGKGADPVKVKARIDLRTKQLDKITKLAKAAKKSGDNTKVAEYKTKVDFLKGKLKHYQSLLKSSETSSESWKIDIENIFETINQGLSAKREKIAVNKIASDDGAYIEGMGVFKKICSTFKSAGYTVKEQPCNEDDQRVWFIYKGSPSKGLVITTHQCEEDSFDITYA